MCFPLQHPSLDASLTGLLRKVQADFQRRDPEKGMSIQPPALEGLLAGLGATWVRV